MPGLEGLCLRAGINGDTATAGVCWQLSCSYPVFTRDGEHHQQEYICGHHAASLKRWQQAGPWSSPACRSRSNSQGEQPIGLLPYSTLFITEAVPAIYFRPQKPERISVIPCYAKYVRKPLVCRVGRCPGQECEWLARMDRYLACMGSREPYLCWAPYS